LLGLERYLAFLTDVARSPNTVKAYAHDLKDWLTFLANRSIDWREVLLDDVGEFVAWLRLPPAARAGRVSVLPSVSGHCTEATINRKLSAVSAFYQHSARSGVELGDLLRTWQPVGRRGSSWRRFLHHVSKSQPAARRAIRLKAASKHPRVLGPGEVQAVLNACERLRDRLLFAVLYDTGMRIGEALGLRHEDWAAAERQVAVLPRLNDNGARSKSDLGIAIGAGTDVAIETADVVLMRSDPLDVPVALTIGKGTLRKMRQNIGWAIGYNAIALPIAAGVFEPSLGLVLRPEIAALSMSGSSLLVAVNACSSACGSRLPRRTPAHQPGAPSGLGCWTTHSGSHAEYFRPAMASLRSHPRLSAHHGRGGRRGGRTGPGGRHHVTCWAMRPTRDVRRQVRGWWPAAVLGAVLLGLAAMHGLAPHGAFAHGSGHEPAAHAAARVQTDVAPSAHGAHASGPFATASEIVADLGAGRPAEGFTEEPAPVGAGALQACVAVLLVVGAVLLARRRRTTGPALLLPRSLNRTVASYRHRHPDPPSLAQLAVLRC
jgi:site-specific recombinase XerC